MKILAIFSTIGVFILSILFTSAQTINLVPFSTGLTSPVDIKNAHDSRLFIVEQAGKIRILDSLGALSSKPFLDIQAEISSGGERGLLGLAFHPLYKTNGYFFVDYTDLIGNSHISRFSVTSNPDSADPASEVNLLTIYQPFTNHNGGNMMFGPDGFLYIDMGDGGSAGDPDNRAQNLDTLLGKILRIDVNNPVTPYYFSPVGNPFYGATPGRDEVWAYGLRNPWRASFDRITGDLWIADVGQNAWEEIDFQQADIAGGQNYGWRCYEGNVVYNTTGCGPASDYVFPIAVYDHSMDCAVTGGYIYRGGQWADLFGYYFYEDNCSGIMRSIKSNGLGGWTVNNSVGTFLPNSYSSFGEDRYGELYIASLSNGTIYKIRGNTCNPTAVITYNNTIPDTIKFCKGNPVTLNAIFGDSLTYIWYLNGNTIQGATLPTFTADSAGNYIVFVTNGSLCSNSSATVVLLDTCSNPYVNEYMDASIIKIYPNPATNKLTIENLQKADIEISDAKGQIIKSFRNANKEAVIDISGFSKGVYIVKATTKKGTAVRRFIKE